MLLLQCVDLPKKVQPTLVKWSKLCLYIYTDVWYFLRNGRWAFRTELGVTLLSSN